MAVEKNIIKVKPDFLEGLNKLNKILTKNSLDLDGLQYIIDKYKFDNFIIRRLISYTYNSPNVLIYLNKYLNYLGIAQCNLIEFIQAFRYILSCNNLLDSRHFYYLKSAACKDDLQMKIIDLLDQYFNIKFNTRFNYKELLFFYNLYLNNIITKQDIHEVDLIVNNNTTTIKLPDFETEVRKPSISVDKLIKQYSAADKGLDLINNEIHQRKLKICNEKCPYFGRELVPFDGNIKNISEVDILLVNLNPDLNDLNEKRTFREKSVIRENIAKFPKDKKWLLINLVPCAFKSKSELGKNNEQIQEYLESRCNHVVLDYVNKNINPKIVILIGKEVYGQFVSDSDFDENLGNIINNKFIPVLHPLSMRQPKSQLKGKAAWENIHEIVNGTSNSAAAEKQTETPQIITKPKKNEKLLLLDTKEINNGTYILMIFTDENGNKFYKKKKNIIPGYVKESSFKDCDILTDSVDIEFTMTKKQKILLTQLLRTKMSKLKG